MDHHTRDELRALVAKITGKHPDATIGEVAELIEGVLARDPGHWIKALSQFVADPHGGRAAL